MLILDLCGGTGSWSKPYRDAGIDRYVVDPKAIAEAPGNIGMTVAEFLIWKPVGRAKVHGILAAPPCTEFAGSGARWWKSKDPRLLTEAINIVRDCLLAVEVFQPDWWCLENPVGRLARCVPELGKWKHTFQPTDYGDPWSKRTCLWGNFTMPPKTPVERHEDPKVGQAVWYASPGPERQRLRSMTPPGFAKAFCEANP